MCSTSFWIMGPIAHGADVNAADYGRTALHDAASDGFADIIHLLIKYGAQIDTRTTDKHQWTPLHIAAIQGKVEAVRALLAHGASADARDGEGNTALDNALQQAGLYRSESDFTNAGILQKTAEVLAVTDGNKAACHIAAALQIIAHYENTGEMYRRGSLQEYEDAMRHFELAREILEKTRKSFEGVVGELYQHIKMGYDLKRQKSSPPGNVLPEHKEIQSTTSMSDRKLIAGILGILLGALGVHRFYLGYTTIGIIQIVVTLVTCGWGALWGVVEGILILTGNFITKDAAGNQL